MLLMRRLADLAVVSFWWVFAAVTCGICAVTFLTWVAVTFILPLVALVSPETRGARFRRRAGSGAAHVEAVAVTAG
jgi:hypothetical protein